MSGIRLAYIALGVVAVLTVVVCVAALLRDDAPDAPAQRESALVGARPTAPTLLVIGDSFAGGTGDPQITAYPELLGSALGYHAVVDAQGGTGFLNDGNNFKAPGKPKTQRAIDRLDHDADTFLVDNIVVDLGRNDLGSDPSAVKPYVVSYFSKLREIWPTQKLAIVVPTYVTTKVEDTVVAMRSLFYEIAGKYQAIVVDPVTRGWYRDQPLGPLLWNDHVHFSQKGNDFYAAKIAKSMLAQGFTPFKEDR
ncbi:SGNH/GDSL hydrolase family protein [Gordonia jacobaea]|uniref:SGNH/GDSL hydrolase family protein n=1 Tax=Gordonia jacobaea TaxID=122202 RepID=UPI003D74D1A3